MITTEQKKIEDRIRFKAAIISLVAAIILFGIKFYAYKLTSSKAIFSDALENITNIITATLTLSVIIISAKPADKDHPYGHGKAEYFASAFEGGAIFFAGIIIIIESINGFFNPTEITNLGFGITLVAIAGVSNGALGLYLKHIGKKYKSLALIASGTHVMSDSLTSIGVIFGPILVKLIGSQWPDPLVALILGIILSLQGVKLLWRSGNELMDGEDKDLLNNLETLLNNHRITGIINCNDMRILRAGRYHHIDINIDVPEFWTIEKGHETGEEFEKLVMGNYENEGEIHFHLDPCRQKLCNQCEIAECNIRMQPFISLKPIKFN